ncbi:MAG: hypothetical protein LLF89_08045 [Spirochaetaceae bacterium]|nr:hypothetical protein [Spirochaetaceae bacterium]
MRTTMRRPGILFAIILMLVTQFAFAEEDSEAAYTIRSVNFKITGYTMERVLRQKANITPGTGFASLEAFESYLEQRRQALLNERVLAEVKAEYTLEKDEDERFLIDITFTTKDSWNIIALPYFKYDSNDGLVLSARARDYNFLGSMQVLVLNIDYSIDQSQRHSYGGLASMNLPFQLVGHDASVNVYEDLAVHADGRPTSSISNLGFSVVLPTRAYPINLSVNQGLQFNPDEVDNDIDPYFLVSSLTAASTVPAGFEISRYGQVSYAPALTASLIWRPGEMVRDDRKGFKLTFSHGLHFGRVDWVNNMRKGMEGHLTNTDAYNLMTGVPTLDFDGTYIYHATNGGKIGFEGRFVGFYSFTNTTRTDLGAYMRGLVDERLWGGAAAFLNLQMPVKLFDFPTHVIIGKNWFDFELQTTPFVDLGYCLRRPGDTFLDSAWYTAGLEFAVYPLRMRTFIVRASAALDLDAVIRNKSLTMPSPRDGYSPYELFFGLGLFF